MEFFFQMLAILSLPVAAIIISVLLTSIAHFSSACKYSVMPGISQILGRNVDPQPL